MTTKEQERKALEQIRNIVESLGAESYIGFAMEGVLEDAEDNIENDFANSWKARAEKNMLALEKAKEERNKAEKDKEYFRQECGRQAEYTVRAESEKIDISVKLQHANSKVVEQRNKIKEMEMEIIKLKAKLYDMIVNEGE